MANKNSSPVEMLVSKKTMGIILLTLIGGILRFYQLGENPLFGDEAYVGLWVRGTMGLQEIFPIVLLKLFSPVSEFELRFIYALAGTLTIPAIWFVLKRGNLPAAAIVALFPLFVFWSRMSRPYAIAGFFVVLGWKWWQFYIPAMFSTPISLIGIRLVQQKRFVLIGAIIFAAVSYLIRPDTGDKQVDFLANFWKSSRFFYLPALTILLYFFDYVYKYFEQK